MSDGKPAPRFPRVKGRLPPQLMPCPGCRRHLYPVAKTCPHCGESIALLMKRQRAALRRAEAAVKKLSALLG